jgi:hypothetical protein
MILVQDQPQAKIQDLSQEVTTTKMSAGMVQVEECLHCKHKAWVQVPQPPKLKLSEIEYLFRQTKIYKSSHKTNVTISLSPNFLISS